MTGLSKSNSSETGIAATRWHCNVEDDYIHAATEHDARAEFIQALIEDPSLIAVREAENGPILEEVEANRARLRDEVLA